jgi:ABC-type transporter Mla subunit MlaD
MLADESGRLMETANQVVAGANRLMANLDAISEPHAILAIVDSARTASANLADASVGVKAMIAESRASLKQSLDSVATASRSASAMMDTQVAGLVGNANSLIGDLRGVIHGNESTLQAAMADLRQASRTFKDIAREVHERPSRLLFSSDQPERKLP